jgi:predicted Rossmann fold flavoprotein
MVSEWFDTVVIGGGPSGMMAAARAAECGERVLLLEKNESLGKKLRITGGGRCNMTNMTFQTAVVAEKLGKRGKILIPALTRFGVAETVEFFHENGLPTKVEAEGRVFPRSDRAEDVLKVLMRCLDRHRVMIRCGVRIDGFAVEKGALIGLRMNGAILSAKRWILATGGRSRPETGSTGDGLVWLRKIGHTVIDPDPALVPIVICDSWAKDLQGVSLASVKLSLIVAGKKQKSAAGKLLFTHFGVSGPLALTLSRAVREAFDRRELDALALDMFPDADTAEIGRRMLELFVRYPNKRLKNVLSEMVAPTLAGALLMCAHVDQEKAAREVTHQERYLLASTVKDWRMRVAGFLGMDKAIVSSGGVDVREVDFRTMRSRKFSNLCIVGDALDFDRPSGGYSLQICWTTGRVAGESGMVD